MPRISHFSGGDQIKSYARCFSAREIAAGLRRGRKSGSGFTACCPAHEDNNPSLSLRESRDGAVLVHCHTGCSQEAVIDALRAKGLWPERERRRWLTPAEWQEQQRYRAEMCERERQAGYFCLALEPLLLDLIEQLPPIETLDWDDEDPERLALTKELARLRVARDKPAFQAVIYGEWQEVNPKLTAAFVWAGEEHERHTSQRIWRWIDAQNQTEG